MRIARALTIKVTLPLFRRRCNPSFRSRSAVPSDRRQMLTLLL